MESFTEILAQNPGWLDELVTPAEASRITGKAEATLASERVRGGPRAVPFHKIGKSVRYCRRDLFALIKTSRQLSTSDTRPAAA